MRAQFSQKQRICIDPSRRGIHLRDYLVQPTRKGDAIQLFCSAMRYECLTMFPLQDKCKNSHRLSPTLGPAKCLTVRDRPPSHSSLKNLISLLLFYYCLQSIRMHLSALHVSCYHLTCISKPFPSPLHALLPPITIR
jgi:hypothetical protein